MRRSRLRRVPDEAWEAFEKKLNVLRTMAQQDLKYNKQIHMTDALKFFSNKQTIVYPEELKGYLNNRKRKRRQNYNII